MTELTKQLNRIIELLEGLSPSNNSIVLNDYFELWQRLYKVDCRASTLYGQKLLFDKYVRPAFGGNLISSISAEFISNFLLSVPLVRTRQKLYTLLRDVFKRAYDNGYSSSFVFAKIDKPKYKSTERLVFSAIDQQNILARYSSVRYGLAFVIMLLAGLRKGEVLALTWEDVDLTNRLISVNKQLDYKNQIVNFTKTANGQRSVPINNVLLNCLQGFKEPLTDRLFNVGSSGLQFAFLRLMRLCGLQDKGYTIHCLRHTCNQNLSDAGIAPEIRAYILGHDKTMNLSTYTHITAQKALQVLCACEDKI